MRPGLAAIVGNQNDAGAGMRVGLRQSAGGPAVLLVEKEDAVQRAADAGVLQIPVQAAVIGMPIAPRSPTAQPC